MSKRSIREELHRKLIEYMETISKWDDHLLKELPSAWENFNGFLVFTAPSFQSDIWLEAGPEIWKLTCLCLKGHSVALKGRIANNGFRSPQAQLVYGNSNIVHYLDNGIKYSWNVEKNMFCVGNVTERHRIAKYNCENEDIVDLFAGIGYFTLPYLIHAKARFVHACEWNPDAVESLRRNLHLNKVEDRCKIYEGDNRMVCPKKIANRVNLGLIPTSEPFWNVACEALLDSGGILYVHNNVTSQMPPKETCCTCEQLSTKLGLNLIKNISVPNITIYSSGEDFDYILSDDVIKWKHTEWFTFSLHICHVLLKCFQTLFEKPWSVVINDVFRVKSYAPHIDHLVYTVICKPL